MSSNNLQGKEAIHKMKEMVEDISSCMMVSKLDRAPLHAIPMTTKRVDDDGLIYFLSSTLSDHDTHIKEDSSVQLLYSDNSSMEFISIYGNARISTDQQLIEELYGAIDNNWFDSKDDPQITVIKVEPVSAHYWDTQSNSVMSAIKMGYTAITNDKTDIGVSGDLDLD